MKELFDTVCRVAEVRAPKVPFPDTLAAGVALGMELWADRVSHKEPRATYRAMRYAQRNAFFSNAKAKRELGLPARPFEETMRRAVRWFRGDFRRLPR